MNVEKKIRMTWKIDNNVVQAFRIYITYISKMQIRIVDTNLKVIDTLK